MAMSLTSRSALRTLNEGNGPQKSLHGQKQGSQLSQLKSSGLEPRPLKFATPSACKPVLKIHTDPAPVKTKVEVKEKVIKKQAAALPDIEQMHICDPASEMKPMEDVQAESMLAKLRKWSMPCLYRGNGADSDSESEEEDVLPEPPLPDLHELDEIDNMSKIALFELDVLGDIDNIPSIDDLPIPFLDDTLDIEPNMGTLEVWGDTSTPLTMSPAGRSRDESGTGDLDCST